MSGSGDPINSLLGVGIVMCMVAVSMQSLLFPFSNAVYSLSGADVIVLAERPFLFY